MSPIPCCAKMSKKTIVCTGTHCKSVTPLNTVVHKNVKVYMNQYVKFFQKLPSAHIFIYCTNLTNFVKFVKIIFDTYSNFIKLSKISKIFWQESTKFQVFCICKVYTNSFIIYQSFLNIFSMILKFPQSFSKWFSNFVFKISTNITQNKYLF